MRALPLLLAGVGLVALLATRRAAAAAAPIYLPESDAYEPGWQQASPLAWGWPDTSELPLRDPGVYDAPDLPGVYDAPDPTPPGAFDYLAASADIDVYIAASADIDVDALDFDNPVHYPADAPDTGYYGGDLNQDQAAANVSAFLWAIRAAEGTANDAGYRTMFGYRYFDSFADHPRQPAQFTDHKGRRLWTSAAGAYQFMAISPIPGGGSTSVDTWDRLQRKLGLPDFSPASQDAAAVELIREGRALADVRAGRFADAIYKVRGTWASLPGAGYDQPERKLNDLLATYLDAGGALA